MRRCYGLTVTTSPRGLAHRDARSDHGYLTTDANLRVVFKNFLWNIPSKFESDYVGMSYLCFS